MTEGSRRILVTGLSTYWGGRLAQALEAFDEVEAVIGVDNEEPQVELERTEYVKVGTQHALLRRVVEAAEIDTVVDTRLVVDSSHHHARQGPREQRDRDDEHPRRLQRRAARPCARSCSSPPPTSTAASRTTRPSSTRPWAARTGRARSIERDVVEAEASVGRVRREEPGRGRDGAALRERARAERAHVAHRALLAAGGADDPGLRPALPVRARGRRGARARARRGPARLRGVYNVAGDGVLALSEVAGLLGKPYAPILPPWGTGLAAAALRRRGRSGSRRRR